MTQSEWIPAGIDVTRPNAARVYDYYLGGFNNFAVDRAMAEQAIAMWPELPRIMRANRAFLQRAVGYLISLGVRQFLDVGSGIPTAGNVHSTAQELAADARVVYVDIDPIAVAHSQALLLDNPGAEGTHGDLRSPGEILADPRVTGLLDLSQPVALLMVAVLHFVGPDDHPERAIAAFRDRLAPGSYLVMSHATHEQVTTERAEDHVGLYRRTATPMTMRTREEVLALFDGFELVPPGLVLLEEWDGGTLRAVDDARWCPAWAGVGKLA